MGNTDDGRITDPVLFALLFEIISPPLREVLLDKRSNIAE
jgi:hypothetical protein